MATATPPRPGRRVALDGRLIRRLFGPVARHPWIAVRLAALYAAQGGWTRRRPAPGGRGGPIRQLSLRLTDLCNLRCPTCGQWGEGGYLRGERKSELKSREVPVADYVATLDDLRRHGHRPIVYLWGGEPMLYPGAMDLVEAAARRRLPAAIATNGTGVPAAAGRMVRAPLFLLQVSIDGPTRALQNRLRPGAAGVDSFTLVESALDAVREARRKARAGLPLVAALTTISRANAGCLTDLYDAFRDRVDFFVFYLSWWIDEPAALAHEKDFERRFGAVPRSHRGWLGTWKPDDPARVHEQIREVRRRARGRGAPPVTVIPRLDSAEDLHAYYSDHACRFGFDRCLAVDHAAEVDSNGDLCPCRDYRDYVVGNIREHPLTELWNDERFRRFRTSLAADGLMPVCSRCCGLMGY